MEETAHSTSLQETQKRRMIFFFRAFLFMVFAALLIAIAMLYQNNNDLDAEIQRKDSLIAATRKLDSVLLFQHKKNESVVEKYISDCNIMLNGKKVTTDELITYINRLFKIIDTLNFRVEKYSDSFSIYRSFYDLAKSRLNTDFQISKNDSSHETQMYLKMPPQSPFKDSFSIYKSLLDYASKKYDLIIDYTFKDRRLTGSVKNETLDSILRVIRIHAKDK